MRLRSIPIRSIRHGLICIFILISLSSPAFSQTFGKNKVQYREFNWSYLQSKHFDVYYYGKMFGLAEFTAEVAESSYVSLRRDLRYGIEKRIPILIYNSHNDYEQTNVSSHIIDESEQGFTELFKDRVVVHFKGDFKAFKYLIHHELTHAVMTQMMYGGGTGSMVTAMMRFQLPLWVWEGMAEFESVGWDTESDMFLRDATINGYVPPVTSLYGWWAYKGGQSLFNYFSEKYGRQKVGEVIGNLRMSRGLESGLKKSIGIGVEDLTERWHKYLRKIYWPDIQDRDEPKDVAKRLTDHVKNKHFLNNSPALSPRGDKLVYLSDRSDFIDIYLMNAIDGKRKGRLVKGQRSELFEELHWTRPGMDWSPDGKQVVFAAKSGDQDALFLMDAEKRQVLREYRLSLDGVFAPSWSPDGNRIAFMGLENGQSDIFVYNLADEKLMKLTNDIFSDLDPAWSPSGDEIVFVSDRGSQMKGIGPRLRMQNHRYIQQDMYILDTITGQIDRLTEDEFQEHDPAFSPDGSKIAFISDRAGIANIYMLDRSTKEAYPITNLLTGVSQISWSREGSRLAFSSFFNGGYDIFLLNNPLDIQPGSVGVKNTVFMENQQYDEKAVLTAQTEDEPDQNREITDFQHYVFGEEFKRGQERDEKKRDETFLTTEEYKDDEGEYKKKKYKIRFTPDIITGGTGYSQFYGIQGSSLIVLSDILGNHQINIYADLFYSIKNSNIQLAYLYLPRRTDYGISIFHYSYLLYSYYTDGYYLYPSYLRDRYFGVTFFASRPFDRFRRFDLGITGFGIERDYGQIDPYAYYYYGSINMEDLGNIFRRRMLIMNLGYNTDTVIWGMTGPVNGGRSNLSLSYSPSISRDYGLDYWTVRGDWRKYIRLKKDYTFAFRFAGGVSGGRQPQRFLLGGMSGWINYQFSTSAAVYYEDDMFFFSSFETPLRGTYYYDMIGTRFLLTNIEFRFPLVQHLVLGWPLPIYFQNIRGVLFYDMGSAWVDDSAWKPFASSGPLGFFQLQDMKAGFGFGARLNMGFFLLKYDLAWGTDFAHTSKPIHYFTMGAEF